MFKQRYYKTFISIQKPFNMHDNTSVMRQTAARALTSRPAGKGANTHNGLKQPFPKIVKEVITYSNPNPGSRFICHSLYNKKGNTQTTSL